MASLVQTVALKLALVVDPRTKAGDSFVASSPAAGQAAIGVTDGDKFTSQRLLDCYNFGRFALFSALRQSLPPKKMAEAVAATFQSAAITWTYSSPDTTAPKPAGYLKLESLAIAAAVRAIVLPNNLIGEVRAAINPQLTQNAATNVLAFENTTNFLAPAIDVHGTGKIDYYGISNWDLSDITGGSTVEVFSTELEPILLELAEAVCNEQGMIQVGALANKLISLMPQ